MKEKEVYKVLYFGTYREEYSRNRIMITGLRESGIEVVECHESLWRGIEDRIQVVQGGWLSAEFLWRAIRTYGRLILKYIWLTKDFDVLIIGYPGHFDVFLARIFAWLNRKPLIWDVFMSIYLISLERGLGKNNRLIMGLIRWIERIALRVPDLLIQDTEEYVDWLCGEYGIEKDRFRLVPTGADDRVYYPTNLERSDTDFHVLYYGTFIPNHGIMQILNAARILQKSSNIKFIMIGEGPDKANAEKFVNENNLKNVSFHHWLEPGELMKKANSADMLLGAFGLTQQSLMTVQNKIFEGLAMRKTVLTGDSPAIQGLLNYGTVLQICERGNPVSLADAIVALYENEELLLDTANRGFTLYTHEYSLRKNGERFRSYLQDLLSINIRKCTLN